jgi:hypothetical protein
VAIKILGRKPEQRQKVGLLRLYAQTRAQLQLDANFRPSHLQPPTPDLGDRYTSWVIIIALNELNRTAKTGLSDDSVVVSYIPRRWLSDILAEVAKKTPADAFLFPGLTLANYEQLVAEAAGRMRCEHI